MKTIYYYQTFVGLDKLMTHLQDIDVIIISSIHFGKDKYNIKNIHLNDNIPTDPLFNDLWLETHKAFVEGTTIMLMVGGAGLAYNELFSDFNTYYPLLKNLIIEKSWIRGVDLDIEENTKLENIQMLIDKLIYDFGEEFIITMAPISPSMINDGSSMAGFNYKQLYHSKQGKHIHWFNTQCYGSFSYDTYKSIIDNNYPPEKIVMGMESGQFSSTTFPNAIHEIIKTKKNYPNFAGVYDWEYLNAPPNESDPSQWAKLLKRL